MLAALLKKLRTYLFERPIDPLAFLNRKSLLQQKTQLRLTILLFHSVGQTDAVSW